MKQFDLGVSKSFLQTLGIWTFQDMHFLGEVLDLLWLTMWFCILWDLGLETLNLNFSELELCKLTEWYGIQKTGILQPCFCNHDIYYVFLFINAIHCALQTIHYTLHITHYTLDSILCCTLHYTIQYHTIPHHAIPYYTRPYNTILHSFYVTNIVGEIAGRYP